MPSERVQRHIDRLLDEAEQAIVARDWDTVAARAEAVLRLDRENADAAAYLDAARAGPATPRADGSAKPTVPSPPPLPTSFVQGRYEVLSLLGEGGRKVVYRARDSMLKREVAFALIKTDGLDEAGRVHVRREAELLAQLGTHPNVVTVFELGGDDGRPFLVSEFLPGGDLGQLIEAAPDRRLHLPRVLELATAVAKGLAYAHSHGVVHRDLKPGNVWLTDDGTPKLGDFGLALADADARLTQAGLIAGTALYMAPEQATGGEVTARSDLYSFGCLLYELVTGRPPFVGDESVAIIGQHLHANPVSPTWHRPDCPTALEALILRLLEKDPQKRPASAQAVVEALAGISPSARRTTSESQRQVQGSGPSPVYQRAFVGRELELRQLEAAFDAAVSGQGGLVMVVGEPGIGKTSITEQLATYAGLRGGRVLIGHCYEEGSLSLPYLPFVEAMRTYVLDREPAALRSELGSAASDIARIVSEVRDRVQVTPAESSGDDAEDRYRLLNAVTTFLCNAAAVQPLVLLLEDLHDADRGTLDLLQFLARQLVGARLLVVGTYRDIEVDRQHPLSATLAELRRGANFSRVLLRGLTADEVQRMIAAIARQEIQWALAETVHRQTEGNPLFVQEVVRYLAESGLVTRRDGRWQAPSAESLLASIPEGLRDVIGRRLSRLSSDCNHLLAVAAVIGREFAFATLLAVSGQASEAVEALLDEALKVAVLGAHAGAGRLHYRFAPAFFRQTLYEELSPPRRLRLHQQVARALEQQYAGRLDEHAAELAGHFAHSTDATDLQKAVQYGEVAAQRASSVYAYGEAVRLLRQALDVQEVLNPDDKDCLCSLLLKLAEAMQYAGDLQTVAEEVAPRAFQLAEALGDRSRASRACLLALRALRRFGALMQATTPVFRQWLERLAAQAESGTVGRVWADAQRADVLRMTGRYGRYGEAWELASQALRLARTLGDAAALAFAAATVIGGTGRPRDRRQRVSTAEEFAPLTEHLSDDGSLWLNNMLHNLFLSAGRWEDAREQVRRLERYVERTGDVRWGGLVAMAWRARWALLDGRLQEALALGEAQGQAAEELGNPVWGRLGTSLVRMWPLVLLGRAEEALQEEPLPRQLVGGEPGARVPASRMLLLACAGHVEEARTALQAFAALLAQEPDQCGEDDLLAALMTAVTLGDAMVGIRLAEQLTIGEEDYGETIVWSLGTCTARYLGMLAALQGDREEAQRRYRQALAVAARVRSRPETALTHLALAELLAGGAAAEQDQAHEYLAFAIAECEAMGMQPALERARAVQTCLGPTSAPAAEETRLAETLPAPAATRTGQVFNSHSSDDHAVAFALDGRLQAEQIPVWLDKRSIPPGSSWDAEIVRGIRSSAVVAVFVSPKAMASDHVRQELRLAMEYRKPVLPLLLHPTDYPDEVKYVLAGRQWVEVLDRGEDAWFPQVLAAVRRMA